MSNFTCEQCSEPCASKPILKKHVSNYHSTSLTCNDITYNRDEITEEFECHCEFKTKSRTDMQNHLRRAHMDSQASAKNKRAPSASRPSPYPQKHARGLKNTSPQPSAPLERDLDTDYDGDVHMASPDCKIFQCNLQ